MSDPVYVADPPVCECCERKVWETAIRPLMSKTVAVCTDCFRAWYEHGETDPRLLNELVWKIHGEFGGQANLTARPQ